MPGITGEFREIVEAHQSRVYSIAYRVLGDRGTAEEVAQDVFLELYRAFDAIASDEHLAAWLRRVTVHRATDALRRRPRTLHGAAEFEDWMAETPKGDGPFPLASEIERLVLALPPGTAGGRSAALSGGPAARRDRGNAPHAVGNREEPSAKSAEGNACASGRHVKGVHTSWMNTKTLSTGCGRD